MRASEAHQAPPAEGATVVITHRLRENALAAYEDWLQEIAPLCKASPGISIGTSCARFRV